MKAVEANFLKFLKKSEQLEVLRVRPGWVPVAEIATPARTPRPYGGSMSDEHALVWFECVMPIRRQVLGRSDRRPELRAGRGLAGEWLAGHGHEGGLA